MEIPAFDPFGADTPGAYVAPVDPFAPAAAADPFAPIGPPAGDPFAGTAADPGLLPDPFGRAAAPGDPSGEAADPFAGAGAAASDPFAADSDPFSTGPGFELDDAPRSRATTAPSFPANGAQTGAVRLPVTDLSHLLGESGAGPAHPAPPAPASAGPAPGELDFSGDLALGPGGADLALEDRSTPAPAALAPSDGALVTTDGFPGDPFSDPGVPSAFAASGGDLPLELATEGAGPQRPAAAWIEAPPAGIPAARPGTGTAPSRPLGPGGSDGATPAATPAVEVAERAPQRRAAPLRALAVNALALAALLAVALAIRVVWRGDASLGAGGLRPSALVGALDDASGEPATFAPVALTNGLYERVSGPPLLFVRGEVLSRAPGPVDGIEVAVELVRDGVVLARGAGRAGAIPTAEELHLAAGPAALAALEAAVRSRAPAEIGPGDRVPFLVAVDGLPADLEGAGLRVVTGPAGAGARR